MSKHRNYYLDKISAEFPLTVKIGINGDTKTFRKGEEGSFFDWLTGSPDSFYMWRGCVDVIGICNLYQMDVDIIVHMEGTSLEVRHFCPDTNFPWNENDKLKPDNPSVRNYPKMTVPNYKDLHFNLVVDKENMVAKSGTFGFQRERVGNPTTQTNRPYENQEDKQKIQMEYIIKNLEIALAETKAENQFHLEKLSGKLSIHIPETFDMLESK